MLDFRIATFLKLCETKSYTNTAKLLHITQPSVTQHIKYLQKRYQCQLFVYEGKTLRLTPEGEYLRRQAQAMSQNSIKVVEDLQRMSQKHKTLRMGCTKDFGDALVPKLIGKMLENDEDLEISLHVENTAELVEMLECGKVDFIFADKSFTKAGFECFDVARDQFCGWACSTHAASLKGHSFKRMFREKLLLREQGSGSRMILEEILEQRNCEVNDFYATMLCNTPSSIKELVASSTGITFGFASGMKNAEEAGKIQRIELSDLSVERELAFMYLKNGMAAETFQPFFTGFRKLWTETLG